MAIKVIWLGVFFILAFQPVLKAVGLNSNEVFVLVGAILFAIGLFMLWTNR
jgi:hypothetical protein